MEKEIMNNVERNTNNLEMKKLFNEIIVNLPQDMRLSKHESDKIIDKFINEISIPLEKIISSMVHETNGDDNQLSDTKRQQLIQKLVKLIIPYLQSVAN